MKIKKGDTVQVITGQDKGTVGEVLAAFPKENRIVVEGVNVLRKHQKPNNANPDGGIIEKECPIHVSNVKIADKKAKKAPAKKAVAKKEEKKAPAKKAAEKKPAAKKTAAKKGGKE